MPQIFQQLLQQSSVRGAKSSALHALQWGIALLLGGISTAVWVDSPDWLLYSLALALGLVFLTFLGTYIFLLFTDRDALRSESFTLSKMAIERGLIGDNITGLMQPSKELGRLLEGEKSVDVDDEGSRA